MGNLTRLLCAAALLGMAQEAAWPQDRACTFAEWGYSYYRIEQQGETWTYVLTASGPNWRNRPYGYHAPGHLGCESCSSASTGVGGLYHFSDQADLRSATAAERAQRRTE